MAVLNLNDRGGLLAFDEQECAAVGATLHDRYTAAEPFPHIVIDDLIDRDLLRRAHEEFPSSEGHAYYDDAQTKLKYQFPPS